MLLPGEAMPNEAGRDHGLIRAVGTWELGAGIVNGVVGAGIFSLPAAMAAAAGTRAPLAYLACTLAMAAVVVCFAEAASRVPTSGGPYGYAEAAFGPLAGFVAGVLLWVSSVLACGGIAAAVADGAAAIGLGGTVARTAIILLVLGGLAWINIRGVAPAARLIAFTTVIKLLPLGLFLLVGAIALLGSASHAAAPAIAGGHDFGRAVILALFAFCGMETPLAASGEVRQPQRTIPRALFLAMGFVALLYISLQLVVQGLLGGRLAGSATPLADGVAVVSPALGVVLLAGAEFSRLSWIGSDLLGGPRVLFAFARDRLLPAPLGRLHPRTRTPMIAIVTHAGLATALALSGTFEPLAVLSTLATAALYFLSCAAAWRLSRRRVALAGTPLGLPLLPIAAAAGMASMVALIALAHRNEIAGLAALLAASVALFALRRVKR